MRRVFPGIGLGKQGLSHPSGGFSLIEVLLAVLIVGVVLAGVYGVYSVFVSMQGRIKQRAAVTAAIVTVAENLKAMPWDKLRAGLPNEMCPGSVTLPPDLSLKCEAEGDGPGLVKVAVRAVDRDGRVVDQLQFLRFQKGF